MDALTEALDAFPGPLPPDLSITLVEAEAFLGGRASSRPTDADLHHEHPHAPWGTNTPHGLHFVWGSYAHLLRLLEGTPPLQPRVGTSTYCAWLAPPDIPGDRASGGRVVAVHVCDPTRPSHAWQPRARRLLAAFQRRSALADAFERTVKSVLDLNVEVHSLLSYMDILFDEENLGPEMRWILFVFGALSGTLGEVERSLLLRDVLGGRAPADADIGELMMPLFHGVVLPRIRRAASLGPLDRLRAAASGGFGALEALSETFAGVLGPVPVLGGASRSAAELSADVRAFADFFLLLTADCERILSRVATYDPRSSGYLKNVLKAAFSSPFGLDVGTAMRDAQFGIRRYSGSVLQLFDADDSRASWEGVAARIEERLAKGKFAGSILRRHWAKRIEIAGDRVTGVAITRSAERVAPEIPTVRPAALGPTEETLEADAVIATLLPQTLVELLKEYPSAREFNQGLGRLGRAMNETINLQLFFPRKLALPFADPPPGADETPPFGISNLEGPFTIVVDLERGWSREAFERIALSEADLGRPFTGSAWELTGAYADLFTFDVHAHPARFQWPNAVQQALVEMFHDPDDFDPATLDMRPWLHDAMAPGRVPPPVMGEVKVAQRDAYRARWRERGEPLVVATTLRQLAALPGMEPEVAVYLEDQATCLLEGRPFEVRYVLVRNGQAENRFFSAEPGLYGMRPHARFEVVARGLWTAGDATRNGLNLQAMEAAVISGLQSAAGVLEWMRSEGLRVAPPKLDPSIMPIGSWDVGLDAPRGGLKK